MPESPVPDAIFKEQTGNFEGGFQPPSGLEINLKELSKDTIRGAL
jgi:hypothetical protein